MKKLAIAAVCLGIATATTAALAGAKYNWNVAITDHGDFTLASGAMGSARNTTDTSQYIGCELHSTASYSTVICFAHTASGQHHSCSTSVEHIKKAVATITDSSYIAFQTSDAAPSQCTSVQIGNASYLAPKQP